MFSLIKEKLAHFHPVRTGDKVMTQKTVLRRRYGSFVKVGARENEDPMGKTETARQRSRDLSHESRGALPAPDPLVGAEVGTEVG